MRIIGIAGVLVLASVWAVSAAASETVLGGNLSRECQYAAETAASYGNAKSAAIERCDEAIASQSMSIHDLAATYVNRGILFMIRSDYIRAEDDFSAAIATLPGLGGAYSGMGSVLIAERRYAEAIEAIDRGLPLGIPQPEKAYFNRALAREELGDVRGAYEDFQTAAGLKPGWQRPRQELIRFTVTKRGWVERTY